MSDTQVSGYNPKKAGQYGRSSKVFYTNLTRDDNPFLDQIQDKDKLKELFSSYKIKAIPYNGTNQNPEHTMLSVLDVLNKVSPTQPKVINSMSFNLFGKIGLVESVDTEFAIDRNEISGTKANGYFENLMFIKPKIGFIETAKFLFKQRKASGEHYLKVIYRQIAGERKVVIEPVNYLNINPLLTPDGEPETFILFKEWCQDTLDKERYEIIGKYPFITEQKDGSQATIIQYKNGIGVRGRPAETDIMIDMFREYKDNIYMTRCSVNNFTAQVFMEFQEADPNATMGLEEQAQADGYENLAARFARNYTNNGEQPASIMATTRPPETDPTFIHEFKQNTSEKWFSQVGGMTRKRIIESHGWSEKLMGDSEVGTGLNASDVLETLKIKLPLIEAQASIEEMTLNIAIDSALMFLGIDFGGVDIKFNNPYKTILDSLTPKDQKKEENNSEIKQ